MFLIPYLLGDKSCFIYENKFQLLKYSCHLNAICSQLNITVYLYSKFVSWSSFFFFFSDYYSKSIHDLLPSLNSHIAYYFHSHSISIYPPLTFSIFFEHVRHIPSSGLLNQLFPLPESFSNIVTPRIFKCFFLNKVYITDNFF